MNQEKSERIRSILHDSTVGIAGIGGLGSNVAMALARAGVGRLVVVDFDEVDESNIDRQAYFLDQVGMRKTEAIIQNIGRVNPDVDVTALHHKLEPGQMDVPFHDVDVIVEALDSAEAKSQFIEEMAAKLPGKPVVAASGVAGIGSPKGIEVSRNGDLHILHDDGAPSCDDTPVWAPRVGVFANWQANIVLELLLEAKK